MCAGKSDAIGVFLKVYVWLHATKQLYFLYYIFLGAKHLHLLKNVRKPNCIPSVNKTYFSYFVCFRGKWVWTAATVFKHFNWLDFKY